MGFVSIINLVTIYHSVVEFVELGAYDSVKF